MTCEEVRAAAAGLAALPEDAPERDEARLHAAGCPECARALRQAERFQALLLAAAPAEAPAVGPLSRTRAAVGAELRRARAARPWTAAALGAAALVAGASALLAAHHRAGSGGPAALGLACGLLLLAALAAVAGVVRPLAAALVGGLAAVLFAAFTGWGDPGSLLAHPGWACSLEELAAALLPLGAASAAVWRGWIAPLALAPAAAAGALAAEAALHLTCPAPRTEAHLLLFHAGAVVLAAILGAAIGEAWRRRPA